MRNHSNYWIEQVQRIQYDFCQFTDSATPNEYIEKIYTNYITTRDRSLIDQAISNAQHFSKELLKCENSILQLVGVGKPLRTAQDVRHNIKSTIVWLEEVLCYAMGDISELVELHTAQQLMYQA
jgi:hypothetical protein